MSESGFDNVYILLRRSVDLIIIGCPITKNEFLGVIDGGINEQFMGTTSICISRTEYILRTVTGVPEI